MMSSAGAALAAIHHPAADQFLLLRDPFGPDYPYGELRRELRHSDHRRRHDLQRGGPCRHGRPIAFGLLGDRFGAKRVLVRGYCCRRSARWPMSSRGSSGEFYARRPVRVHLCRHHAALCGARAREFPAADDGNRHRRHRHGRKPRHGDGPLAGGLIYDTFAELQVALYRLLGHRRRRLPDRLDLQASGVPASHGAAPA